LLMNLASVCQDIGQHRAALNGYLGALAQTHLIRLRLTGLGSAAAAAARLGEQQTVHALVDAGMSLVTLGGHEYETADMLREFSEAFDCLGDVDRAAEFRKDALERARYGEFFEIVHRLEDAPRVEQSATAPAHDISLAPDALDVATQLAAGDSGGLLVAAISNDRWDSYTR
jgi:hypothetical protein